MPDPGCVAALPGGLFPDTGNASPTVFTTLCSMPWIAFAIGGGFMAAWRRRRARSAMIACVVWLPYGAYEILLRFPCPGECKLPGDLRLIYPLLLALSLIALWNSAGRRRPMPRHETGAATA
jgi:hypothetical protein